MADSILIYAASGGSKTTQCGEFHRYHQDQLKLYNQPLVPGWHVTGDSTFAPLADYIQEGAILPWNIAYEAQIGGSPISAVMNFSRGMVPAKVDPLTGCRDPQAGWQWATGVMSVEGLHVIAELWKYHLMTTGNMQHTLHTDMSGATVGTAQLAIYDIVKNNLHEAVTRMRGLPFVRRVLWTTHEAKGTDQASASVLGPAILVNKNIDKVPGWFANTLRLTPLSYQGPDGKQDTARALYFEPHQDPITQLFWPAKTSLTPRRLQRLKARSRQVGASGSFLPCVIGDDGTIRGGIYEFLQACDSTGA